MSFITRYCITKCLCTWTCLTLYRLLMIFSISLNQNCILQLFQNLLKPSKTTNRAKEITDSPRKKVYEIDTKTDVLYATNVISTMRPWIRYITSTKFKRTSTIPSPKHEAHITHPYVKPPPSPDQNFNTLKSIIDDTENQPTRKDLEEQKHHLETWDTKMGAKPTQRERGVNSIRERH